MQYCIRKALPGDIGTIIELCAEHAVYEKAEYQSHNKATQLSKMLFGNNPQLHCLLAEAGSEIAGYATFSRECSTWNAGFYVHLDCLFLKEKFRGFGIGEAIVKQVAKHTQQINAHYIEWQTPIFNDRAIKFYNRIGACAKEKFRFTLNV